MTWNGSTSICHSDSTFIYIEITREHGRIAHSGFLKDVRQSSGRVEVSNLIREHEARGDATARLVPSAKMAMVQVGS